MSFEVVWLFVQLGASHTLADKPFRRSSGRSAPALALQTTHRLQSPGYRFMVQHYQIPECGWNHYQLVHSSLHLQMVRGAGQRRLDQQIFLCNSVRGNLNARLFALDHEH